MRRREGADYVGGGSTHAWCQVYLPGAGWVEFDPTNGIIGNRDLIRVAVARDPSQAVPLSGTYAGSPDDELGMKVQVNVEAETQSEDADAARGVTRLQADWRAPSPVEGLGSWLFAEIGAVIPRHATRSDGARNPVIHRPVGYWISGLRRSGASE